MEITISETNYAYALNEIIELLGDISDACNYLSLTDYAGYDESIRSAGQCGVFSVIAYASLKALQELKALQGTD